MIAIWIFLNVFFIVIIVEFFTFVRKNKPFKNTNNENKPHGNYDFNPEKKEVILDKYSTLKDVQIELLPGKFLIKKSKKLTIQLKEQLML